MNFREKQARGAYERQWRRQRRGGGDDEGMVDGNVSVPEVTLFYSCGATSGLAQTPCAEYGQFPYAKRRSDVEQSGIARIRRVVRFGSIATIQPRNGCGTRMFPIILGGRIAP